MEELLESIYQTILANRYGYQARADLLSLAKRALKQDKELGVKYLKRLSESCEKDIPLILDKPDIAEKTMELHKQVLLAAAPHDFDSYILYMEWNREPQKQFYRPRRRVLKQLAEEMQRLADGKLDLLAISLPPGVGKSTLAIFYLTWIAGKFPDEPSLTGSHSNAFVRGVYDEVIRMVDPDGEYLWHDVFPSVQLVNTNAKDCRLDFGHRKRFETLEFTSIGTGNAGLYRAARLLYCDDLVSGIEVALSKDRLAKLWETYTTDLRQRKIGDHCAELQIATRWDPADCIGRLEVMYGESDRAKFIVVPALDENDESNFDYDYGVGFSTKFYHDQREIMDSFSWRALYMNNPVNRDGTLYNEDELRRYFELPDRKPDAILSVCDTKDKGSDYCVLPVVYQYGNDFYLEDMVCDNAQPEVVETELVMCLCENKVQMSCFESNSAGGRIAEKVQKEVKYRGGITKIITKYTTANKETKILVNSPWVKDHVLFKDKSVITQPGEKNKVYRLFMNMLSSYSMVGKNKHDDVPDAMAQLAEYIQTLEGNRVTVGNRFW